MSIKTYNKNREKIQKLISIAFANNIYIIKNFTIEGSGYGGRDDNYFGVYLTNKENIEINILFWVDLFNYDESKMDISFSCFKKINKDKINRFFDNSVLYKNLQGNDIDGKIESLLFLINSKLVTTVYGKFISIF